MATINPLKLVPDTATLEAHRQHQRAIRAAARPWLTVALVMAPLAIAVFLYALFHESFRTLNLLSGLLAFVFASALAIAGIRARRYSRAHPFEPPEPPSAFRAAIQRRP
jgi:hypothetical protein